ncbi:MAG: MBL fold metallo-hydrolase [Clostridia bacterium]|nr:MBL fold metallo-hydrolase [Clostridia bacterium]
MARRRRGRKGKHSILITVIVIILIALGAGIEKTGVGDVNPYSSKDAYVHFIDVGQGSSALIQVGSKGILIDAGETDYGDYVVEYLNSCGIEELEYVIASHPHSDHIGGMCDVLDSFTVGEFIMPLLTEINIPTTRVYENMLNSLFDKDITISVAEVGAKYEIEGASLEIFGPVEQTIDLNDMSVICKVNVNGTEFMFLGDAEKPELSSVYNSVALDFEADVIAMGHHGSSTSIHKKFLNAVDADVAVISCGKDNSYGHPNEEALEYIDQAGMTLYRTDYEGDIVFKCTEGGYERIEN